MLRCFLIFCLLLLAPLGCSGNTACGAPGDSDGCTRVLFVGNSYTLANDLPAMFAKLAKSGGRRVETGMVADGGLTLADHAASPATAAKLASARWGVVVLQEQSQIPSVSAPRQGQMYPAARQLVRMIDDAGAMPMFFLTWARRDGWPENGMASYARMQSAIDDGYLAIAREQHVAVAPVGFAWSTAAGQEGGSRLWQDDGSHPAAKGTYLAACVFYASIFRQSPLGLTYHAGLAGDEAAQLQKIAADTVLGDVARWGLRPAE
jgi:hypothetical protein